MTTVDSNGIIRYQTTDPVSPLQTLLNLGMQSVSDAITPLNARSFKTVTSTTRPAHLAGLRIYETDTKKSYISDGTNWASLAPTSDHAWLVKSTAFTVPAATPTSVSSWDSVDSSAVTVNNATGLITILNTGWYEVSFSFIWQANNGGGRTSELKRNRGGTISTVLGDNRENSGTRPTPMIGTGTMQLVAGDLLTLDITHSGSTAIGPMVASQPVYLSITSRR